jgi:hypothetical protein
LKLLYFYERLASIISEEFLKIIELITELLFGYSASLWGRTSSEHATLTFAAAAENPQRKKASRKN